MRRTLFGKDIYLPLDAFKTTRRIEIRMLNRYLDVQPGDRLLDIGCGTGYWTEKIAGPAHATGIDILTRDLRIAARQHRHRHSAFSLANAERLPFPGNTFDKIFGVCSVEHIPDDKAAFAEFARCLRPGGVLAITVDSLNYAAISDAAREAHARRYHVAHFYDIPSITQKLAEAGFTVTHTQYLLCSPLSHAFNLWATRNRKLQYVLFPLSYPLTIWWDGMAGRKDQGWKLAVRAVRN